MYGLYGYLLAKGQIAFLNAKYDDPDFIAVYPEVYNGNETGAKTVVRYILQTPGMMSSFGVPGPSVERLKSYNDHIFVFSKIYDPYEVDNDHLFFLPILNLHVFKAFNNRDNHKNNKRTKTAFLVGKGINTYKHPDDAIEITRKFATDQKALADLLNECDMLYCYDRLSAMMDIARLCGCKVRYYGNFSKEELQKYEPGTNGLTYKDEDERQLKVFDFRSHYKDLITEFDSKLDTFIDITQSS